MTGAIEVFMSADHTRLDRLLEHAERGEGAIDTDAYETFRSDLLRHIAMEEKVLLPFARAKRNGEPLDVAKALRVDHGQIAKLLVPTPTREIIGELRRILTRHNALEEGADGLYATCDALAGAEAAAVVDRLKA